MNSIPHLMACLFLLVLLDGCTPEKPSAEKERLTEHSDKESKESKEQSATYEEGKGLLLKPESSEAIGLEFAKVRAEAVSSRVAVEAQIYAAAGDPIRDRKLKQRAANASAVIPAESAQPMKVGDRVVLTKGTDELTGSLAKFSSSPGGGAHHTTLIMELIDPKKLLRVGEFIQVTVASPTTNTATLTIPRRALLETITGPFVFLEREGHLLRIPVTTGAITTDSVEITGGLTLGERVVTAPVELIYLTELRLTKGGGHTD
ncbi:MAG: hypothetical protein WCO97_00510 [bacterium]